MDDCVYNVICSGGGLEFRQYERSHRGMMALRRAVDDAWGGLLVPDGFDYVWKNLYSLRRSYPGDNVMLKAFGEYLRTAESTYAVFRDGALLFIGYVHGWPVNRISDPDREMCWFGENGVTSMRSQAGYYPYFMDFKELLATSPAVRWTFDKHGHWGLGSSYAVCHVPYGNAVAQRMIDYILHADTSWMDTEESREAVACLVQEGPSLPLFLRALMADGSWRVRRALCLNTHIRYKWKAPLLNDRDWHVRAEMAGLDEPLKSLKGMSGLVNDRSYEVRIRMASRMADARRDRPDGGMPEGYADYLELLLECPYDDDFKADVMMEAVAE